MRSKNDLPRFSHVNSCPISGPADLIGLPGTDFFGHSKRTPFQESLKILAVCFLYTDEVKGCCSFALIRGFRSFHKYVELGARF